MLAVVFDRIGKQVDQNLLDPGSIGIGKPGVVEGEKAHLDVALLRLRFDHGLAFAHDIDQRHRFSRQRQLAGLDHRKIEDFVNQFQQIPAGLDNLV